MIATHPCILLLTLACSSAAAVVKKSEKRQTSTCSSYSKWNSLFFHQQQQHSSPATTLFFFWLKTAIINTRGTGEPPGPCPEFITMNQNILSKLPGGKVYNTNYRAALDQISEYGTDDVRLLFFFHSFPFTTDPNLTSSSRSSPTSAQPSNPNPTNVLFSKAILKARLRLFPRSPVSHYHHPHPTNKEKMEMQSRRCF